jgi:hypothetical protein
MLLAVGGGVHATCKDDNQAATDNPITLNPSALTLAIGESARVGVFTEGDYKIAGCEGLIGVTDEGSVSFTVTGKAVGECRLAVSGDATAELAITVVAMKEPSLCTVPVGKGEELDGRALYRAEVDLDAAPQTCALRTATVSTREQRATVELFSGSPGYSLKARFDYRILTAVPGQLTSDGDGANLSEGAVVDATLGPRTPPDAGPTKWSLRFRMNPDPDPAKWTVTLFRFDKS